MSPHIEEGSKDWWTAQYAGSQGYLYGKAPSSFLVDHLDLLRKGETLDVGMGEGRNAVYLASKGFQVTGIDFINIAAERAKTLARETSVAIDIRSQDLSFFLIPLMKYSTIVVCNYHPPLTILKSLTRGLDKGGTLIMEGYTMEHLRLDAGYKPQPFECFRPNEALEHIRELHVIYYNERVISPKEARVQVIARKTLK